MEFHKAKQVVIITEAVIADSVIELITRLGAPGYTLQGVTGKGERGVRAGTGFSNIYKNMRVEVIANEKVARAIAESVAQEFFDNYAGIVYLHEVEVIRAAKYGLLLSNT
jgi:nitrogen regulatory protein PII